MSKNMELCCVGVAVASRELSRLLARVEAGEDVVISRRGEPVARLIRVEPKARAKTLGLLQGRIVVPDDFNNSVSPESLIR